MEDIFFALSALSEHREYLLPPDFLTIPLRFSKQEQTFLSFLHPACFYHEFLLFPSKEIPTKREKVIFF